MKISKVLFLAASLLTHQSGHAEPYECIIDAHVTAIQVGKIDRNFCNNYDCVSYDFTGNSPNARFPNKDGSSYLDNDGHYALFDNLLTSLVVGSSVSALGPSSCYKDNFETYFVSMGYK